MVRFLAFTFTTLVTLGLIILVYSFATDQLNEEGVEATKSSGYEDQENDDSDKQSITISQPEENDQSEENGQSEENESSQENNQSELDSESISSESEAEERVKQSIALSDEGNYRVEFDHKNDDHDWVVQVYEVVEREEGSHTATYGWYTVNSANGKVNSMF